MKKRIVLAISAFLPLVGNISAQEVPIKDVLPVLAEERITEQPSNVWFLLDDSGSMGWETGMAYNPNTVYILPKDDEGHDFPLPQSRFRAFTSPFREYVQNGSTNGLTATRNRHWRCRNRRGADLRNCRVWDSFYRTKMLAMKSSLSLALLDLEKIRWGFRSLHNNGVTQQFMPVDIESSDGKTQLYGKVFSLFARGGTPLRGRFANLVRQIKGESAKTPTVNTKHVGLYSMQEDYSADKNPVLACRRNHTVLLTDGDWNGDNTSTLNSILTASSAPSYRLNVGTEKDANNNIDVSKGYTRNSKFILPDGMVYNQYRPYIADTLDNQYINIADIAFVAWANDLNDDPSDNSLLMVRNLLPDANGNEIYYSNDTVTNSGTVPASLKSEDDEPITQGHYWHPYNDPASWQHINTHTITFGLPGANARNTPLINPPKSQQDAVTKSQSALDISRYIDGVRLFGASSDDTSVGTFFANQNPRRITTDDMARAAVAGRGQFHNVNTPQGLIEAFQNIFAAINDSNLKGASVNRGSAAAVASGSVGSQQVLFTSQFNPKSFAGDVIAFPVYDGTQSPSDCWIEPQRSQNTDSDGNVLPTVGAGTFCNNEAGRGAWKASDSVNNTSFTGRNVVTSVLKKVGPDEIDTLDQYDEKVGEGENFELEVAEFKFDNLKMYRRNTSKGEIDEEAVNYIRGDDSREVRNGGSLRDRVATQDSDVGWLLGDIGRSAPVFVSSRPTLSNDHFVLKNDDALNAYVGFRNLSRPDMVYFGSNDGMLHALDATPSGSNRTDRESFAYVPHMLFDKLPKLTKDGEHNSFVDGKLTVELVYEGEGKSRSNWHLRLVSGLGSGGKGIFSLDVSEEMTDISKFANARPWEYGEKDSQAYNAKDGKSGKSNVGNILARPALVQVNNTSDTSDSGWVVAVGNGYNAESNKAALILIDAFTGEVIQELVLDTSQNSTEHRNYIDNDKTNGLGPLFFLSYEGKDPRRKYQVDRAYAGDLQGNLWVFDFSSLDIRKCRGATTKVEKEEFCVKVASKQFDSNNVIPLFTAIDENGKRQPITVAPLVEEHPTGFGYLVHFGTGALFDRVDLSLFAKDDPDTPEDESAEPIVNSIYALWDDWVPFGIGSGSGLETPKEEPIQFDRENESALRKLEWSRMTVQNSSGQSIEVRTLARDNQDQSPRTTWAFGAADLNPDGNERKRGWFIDLDPRERAWQRPFVAFGENNVRSISYVTTTYPDKDNDTVVPSCTSSTEAPFSWTIAFDPDDGSQLLSGSGTIDTNSDGRVCSGCAKGNANGLTGDAIKDGLGSGTAISVTGKKSIDTLLSNANPTPTPPGQGLNSCPGLMQITSNANNSGNSQAVACRPLLPSSWQELK